MFFSYFKASSVLPVFAKHSILFILNIILSYILLTKYDTHDKA